MKAIRVGIEEHGDPDQVKTPSAVSGVRHLRDAAIQDGLRGHPTVNGGVVDEAGSPGSVRSFCPRTPAGVFHDAAAPRR